MSLEYAPRGLVGVLTPQANTTVEPEFNILLPAGMCLITGRLVSSKPRLESRLQDYFDNLNSATMQFSDAPLRALGVACTGSSYLSGPEHEDALFAALAQHKGIHVTSSAIAVVNALRTLNARQIGLVSPYPDNLHDLSVNYWTARGFEVKASSKVVAHKSNASSTNPIYTLDSSDVTNALMALKAQSLDAIVMLGTGMPSLPSILLQPSLDGAAVISCTLALAWECVCAATGENRRLESLQSWIKGDHWHKRLRNES